MTKKVVMSRSLKKKCDGNEKLWHIYSGGFRGSTKDYKYCFFCDWFSLSIALGSPLVKDHSDDIPEHMWVIDVKWWPLRNSHIWVWKHDKMILNIGDG
jgi:hypothetical protein